MTAVSYPNSSPPSVATNVNPTTSEVFTFVIRITPSFWNHRQPASTEYSRPECARAGSGAASAPTGYDTRHADTVFAKLARHGPGLDRDIFHLPSRPRAARFLMSADNPKVHGGAASHVVTLFSRTP